MEWVIVIAIVVVIALFVIGIYNGLIGRRNRVDEALAQIEVQLKRRHDLIPNLVDAVKGYMGFEQKVLTDVTEARANAVAAGAQGVGRPGPGRERADRHPALAVRGRRELPRAQGQPERPEPAGAADDDREPDLVQPPALQRHASSTTTTASRRSRTTSSPGCSASPSATSSTPSRRPRTSRRSTSA